MITKHQRKVRLGRVVSDKMDKTVVVAVGRQFSHPIYKKILRRTRKYKAHNEDNQAKAGDIVRIVETRPLSKEKRWRVAEIVSRGEIIELPSPVLEPPPKETPQAPAAEAAAGTASTEAESAPPAEEPEASSGSH